MVVSEITGVVGFPNGLDMEGEEDCGIWGNAQVFG